MKRIALLLTLAFAVGLLFTTGCVQNPGIPGMGPTASPTGGTPGTLTTGPTQSSRRITPWSSRCRATATQSTP